MADVEQDDWLAGKLAWSTGVGIYKRKGKDRMRFGIKDQQLIEAEDSWDVIAETHDDFLKGW